jgi:hypothetical protein
MRDVELYRQLLGLNTPWIVTPVELKVGGLNLLRIFKVIWYFRGL